MPPLSDLCGSHKGEEMFVIGTGPSLRVFPLEILSGKLTVGLNQAWRHGAWTYSLTVHSELILDYQASPERPGTKWIVSAKKKPCDLSLNDKDHFVFRSRGDFTRDPNELFLREGIQGTALHLALRLGCRAVYFVGVDMGLLDGDHHCHEQHVKYHSRTPGEVFARMRKTTRLARDVLRKKGVPVLNLTALLGVDPSEDYAVLTREMGLPHLPKPEDTSDCVWGFGYSGDKL